MMRNNVVLPAPFFPHSRTHSPLFISNAASCRIVFLPKRFSNPENIRCVCFMALSTGDLALALEVL